MTGDHLVITVHGIRTFGQWQERLEVLVTDSSDEDIEFTKIDYGYFSVIAFFIPFVRWLATRRIKHLLLETLTERPWRPPITLHRSVGGGNLPAAGRGRDPAGRLPRQGDA